MVIGQLAHPGVPHSAVAVWHVVEIVFYWYHAGCWPLLAHVISDIWSGQWPQSQVILNASGQLSDGSAHSICDIDRL